MTAPLSKEDRAALVAEIAGAMEAAEFGYGLRLTRLVDDVSTYTLTYSDGAPPIEFDDQDEAYEHIRAKKREAQAGAALEVVLARLADLKRREASDER